MEMESNSYNIFEFFFSSYKHVSNIISEECQKKVIKMAMRSCRKSRVPIKPETYYQLKR